MAPAPVARSSLRLGARDVQPRDLRRNRRHRLHLVDVTKPPGITLHAQQRRVRQEVPPRDARRRRRVPRLRQRRLAGRPARERHELARAAARDAAAWRSITTRATARSPTSPRPPDSTSISTAWASPSADYDNDGFHDILHHGRRPEPSVPQHRARHVRRRHEPVRPRPARLASAPRRCGSTTTATGGWTCWSATTSGGRRRRTSTAAWTASRSRTARPEAYRGTTSWLFRNKGDGTFEDVTAKAGLFDTTSKSLGVTMIDYDLDRWPDVFIANDTQPNKLYRNNGNGTFTELGLQAGLAFSEDGRARAGMGADAADVDNSGHTPWSSPTSPARCSGSTGPSATANTPTRRRAPTSAARRRARSASAASSSTRISTGCSICSS